MVFNKLNIVVTAYNNEKYIEKCLKSIIKQRKEYVDFKITIAYDRGSSDKTFEICEKYMEKYTFIDFLMYPNDWVGAIRNKVAKRTKEEYITFVDGDDWLPRGAIKKMMSEAIDKDIDCILGKMECVYPSGRRKIMPVFIEKDNGRICSTFMHPVVFKTSAYNKNFYCMELIKTHEDRPSGYLIPVFSEKYKVINEVVYCYGVRPKSSIRNAELRVAMINDVIEVYKYMFKFKRFYSDKEWKIIEEDLTWSAVASLMFVFKIKNRRVRLSETERIIDLLDYNFPNWRNNEILNSMKGKPFVGEYIDMLINDRDERDFIDFTESYKMKIIEIGTEKYALNGWLDLVISKIKWW